MSMSGKQPLKNNHSNKKQQAEKMNEKTDTQQTSEASVGLGEKQEWIFYHCRQEGITTTLTLHNHQNYRPSTQRTTSKCTS